MGPPCPLLGCDLRNCSPFREFLGGPAEVRHMQITLRLLCPYGAAICATVALSWVPGRPSGGESYAGHFEAPLSFAGLRSAQLSPH
eukprot:2655624-Pyramimonas_sp.AAC.1